MSSQRTPKLSVPTGSPTLNSASLLLNRVARAWQRRSFAEFVKLIVYNVGLVVTGKYRKKNEIYDLSFDQAHGIDTIGREEAAYLSSDEELRAHARGYEPVSAARLHALIAELPRLPLEDFHFIDFGSGKGRALFLASQYPFRAITGVEYSPALHETALRNIQVYRDSAQRCFQIRSVCADASTFELPGEPTLCFMYNPFDELLIRKTIDNIANSLRRYSRPFYLLYLNAEHPQYIHASPDWHAVAKGAIEAMPFVIWEWRPA